MYENAEKTQVRRHQAERAIQLAMANRWEEAVSVNRAILTLFPNDDDSYNRLGKALMELGRYDEAKKAYKKALGLDVTNQIARKNLARLNALIKAGKTQVETAQVDPAVFIEEMGKSAITTLQQASDDALARLNALIKAGKTQVETAQVDPAVFIEEMGKSAITTLQQASDDALARLNAGDALELRPKGKKLAMETTKGEFIGTVEPKLAHRLIKLMEGGNTYTAAVTSLSENECRVIIKETYRHPSQAGRLSFPTAIAAEGMRPYTKGSLLRYQTQVEDVEREEEAVEEDAEGRGRGEAWASEQVLQEGDVPLYEAAAAEDLEDEELEE